MINEMARSYIEDPDNILELLEFNSHFYQYSVKNTMLIQHQNGGATFVQSYGKWKKMGTPVKKGEKGLKIYRPEQATILKIGDKLVPLEHATKEEKMAYEAGEIDSTTKTYFKLDYVYDIAQTSYPKDKLPKYFFMGYPSEKHDTITKGLIEYALKELGCNVTTANLESISLRGMFKRETNEIVLNELLEDTQRLSTMSHELGHAIVHNVYTTKTTAQKELEADALGVMLENHFGIKSTETRRRHLTDNFKQYQELAHKDPDMKPIGEILFNINATFNKVLPDISKYVERQTGINMNKAAVLEQTIEDVNRQEKEQLYSDIKEQIRILDYAAANGMEVKKAGRYYTLKEHDSVRIDPKKNCFYRNSGIGTHTAGSVIDFALEFVHSGNKHGALSELQGMLSGRSHEYRPVAEHKSVLPFVSEGVAANLPEPNKDMRRAYAYLIKSRYLDQDIVQEFINRKMLYQDIRGNCVFVAYGDDGQPNYATFRGTLTGKKYLGDVPGNDYSKGFYISNDSDKMIVAESVIDVMSIMSVLKGQGIDYNAYDYLALAGTAKTEPVLNHLKEKPMKEVLLSMDNDTAGVKGMKNITTLIKENNQDVKVSYHIPISNDWNEELSQAGKKFAPLTTLTYLEEKKLPEIRLCAIQSTETLQESGFRIRNGKHQYRLVELDSDGFIVPVATGTQKQNKIYFTSDEVKKLVPNLYELVPYQKLETLQQETELTENVPKLAHNEESEISPKLEAGTEQKNEENVPKLAHINEQTIVSEQKLMDEPKLGKVFYAEDGVIMAYGQFDGIYDSGAVWKQKDGKLVVGVGYSFDGSYKEYLLSNEDMQELMNTLGITVDGFKDGCLYDVRLGNKNLSECKQKIAMDKENVRNTKVAKEAIQINQYPTMRIDTDMTIGL